MKILSKTILAVTLLTSVSSNSLFATAIPIDFGGDVCASLKLKNGFSPGEVTHRWTDGMQAELVVKQNGFIQSISFNDLQAYNNPHTLIISVNGANPTTYTFDHSNPKQTITVNIPRNLPKTRIHFDMPDAVSPQALGLSSDVRVLGLFFSKVDLICDSPLTLEEALTRARALQVPNDRYPDQYSSSNREFWNESGSFRLSETTVLESYDGGNRMHDLERPGAYYVVKDPELKGMIKWEARNSTAQQK